MKARPIVLVILDGWGYSEATESNAILAANKPAWDQMWDNYPHTLIEGSGLQVGLPLDQMGNSEVGHLNLGAGRVVYQEFTRIDKAIQDGIFASNEVLTTAVAKAAASGGAVHILGLLSAGGVHSHEEQIHSMIRLAVDRGAPEVYLHAFLDGRDTPPKSATTSLEKVDELFASLGKGRTASIIGRYFAMDRDQRWSRIQQAFELITAGKAQYQANSAVAGLELAYQRGESDEFVKATTITAEGGHPVTVKDGDVIVFMNFRADRARELTQAFIDEDFTGFERVNPPKLGMFVSLTQYNKDFDIPVAYPPLRLNNVFGEYISKLGLHQLRIAETEKYAHVTFFFNGGEETPFVGEDRILVASPNVATYDLKPEMSAFEVTDKLVAAIESNKYDVIICNYANADMVGHTGNFPAVVKAIEALDTCLGKVRDAVIKTGGEMLITADHGNAEQMADNTTRQAHTAHTTNKIPLIYVGRPARMVDNGVLSDIAPTMLYLMGVEEPQEMEGHSLIELL